MTEDRTQLAILIGRTIAEERALLTLIGSPRRNEPAVIQRLLHANFEMGHSQITSRLASIGLPSELSRVAEQEFAKTATAILRGVAAGKYTPAPLGY